MPSRVRTPSAARGRRLLQLALPAAMLLGFVTSCGGNDDSNANQIVPVTAGINIPSPPTYAPVVWLDPVGASGDLVTVDVKLRTSGPLEFSGFTLYFRFDPTVVQFAGAMQPMLDPQDPGKRVDPFGACGSFDTYCSKHPFATGSCNGEFNGTCMILQSGICNTGIGLCQNPLAPNAPCTTNSDCDRGECDGNSGPDTGKLCKNSGECTSKFCDSGNVTGTLCLSDADCEQGTSGPLLCQLAGMVPGEVPLFQHADINGQCDSYIVSGGLTEVLLLRVAFVVSAALGRDAQGMPIGTRLELISQHQTGMTGDCAILDPDLVPLAIPCDDGMAELTGVR